MEEIIEQVLDFNDIFNIQYSSTPTLVPMSDYRLRHKLMEEENNEYLDACSEGNLVEIADALGDQLYILCGTILKHGLQDKIVEVFNEIHRSNLSKLDVCPQAKEGKAECDDGNCYKAHRGPIIRKDGKILKGPHYSLPNIKDIINEKKES